MRGPFPFRGSRLPHAAHVAALADLENRLKNRVHYPRLDANTAWADKMYRWRRTYGGAWRVFVPSCAAPRRVGLGHTLSIDDGAAKAACQLPGRLGSRPTMARNGAMRSTSGIR